MRTRKIMANRGPGVVADDSVGTKVYKIRKIIQKKRIALETKRSTSGAIGRSKRY